MVSTGFSSLILSCLLIATVRSFSPPVHQLFDVVARSQDNPDDSNNEIAIEQNGAEDLAESTPSTPSSTDSSNLLNEKPAALSSDVPLSLNDLDTQLPPSKPDVNSLDIGNDELSASNDQHNPIVSTDSQNLALDNDGLPIIPNINIFGGSGGMYYGPNPIEQIIQQIWHAPFDVKNQPKPECKARTIPWGGGKSLPMFAFCCGGVPRAKGPNNQNQKRRSYRRKNCYLWDATERCTPDSIHCCFCKNDQKTAYECEKYYTDEGVPANPKRNIIPVRKRQDITDDSLIAASSPGQLENKGTSPSPDNSFVATDLGGSLPNGNRRGSGPRLKPWVCRIDFERAQGAIRQEPFKPEKDPNVDSPYEEYDPADELDDDDYRDLIPRPGYGIP